MTLRTRCLVVLISLSLVDMLIPAPVLGSILLYVMFQKPPWFRNVVEAFYGK